MTTKVFKKYMSAGLGRCYTALKSATDASVYKDTVLYGCMNSLSYDTQSEGTRAQYVFELTQFFGDDDFFLIPTAEKFKELTCENDNDFAHMAELLDLFYKKGNAVAEDSLRFKYCKLLSELKNKRDFSEYDYERDCFERLCIILLSPSPKKNFLKIAEDLGKLFECNSAYSIDDFDYFVF